MQPVAHERRGFWVTDLARTVADVLRAEHPADGLSLLDSALRGGEDRDPLDIRDVRRIIEAVAGGRGVRRARMLLDLGGDATESVGESISQWAIREAGLEPPLLQQEFRDRDGVMRVDFWWPGAGLIGEFDGQGKYLSGSGATGVDAARSVIEEKWREDRLRALGPRLVRWGWRTARTPGALAALLRSASLT